jgi:hypothetical protein
VHLRRALLLFAIVLGLAALAASVSRPGEESDERADRPPASQQTPSVSPGNEPESVETVELVFVAEREQTRRLDAGQPAAVLVEVDEPGMVEIPDLGVSSPADPLTPARFEVFVPDLGRFDVFFTPAGMDLREDAGTLVVQ